MAAIDLKPHTKRLGNNDYIMVSGRILLARADNEEALSIETEIVSATDQAIIVKATVTTHLGTFTGHAASNMVAGTAQEKKTPLEVAETSAVGRALGFAGYGIDAGIASADEMERGGHNGPSLESPQPRVRLANRGQIDEVLSLVNATSTKLEALVSHYGASSLADLTEQQAAHAITTLQRKNAKDAGSEAEQEPAETAGRTPA